MEPFTDDVFEIVKTCVKCNDTVFRNHTSQDSMMNQTKRTERTHVPEDGDEDNLESHYETNTDKNDTVQGVEVWGQEDRVVMQSYMQDF